MATNKHAIIRYKALDKCFRNRGRKYSFEDLRDEVNLALSDFDSTTGGIQTRQLRDDIKFMRSDIGYDADIKTFKEGRKHYYCYEDPSFSINNSPLNSTEAEQLKAAISVLQRFEGAPQFEWMNEIGPLLTNEFGLNNSEKKIMAYDTNVDYAGYEYITPLFNAISNKRVLKVSYKPFNQDSFQLNFHPYFLKEYNSRWFVIGYNPDVCNPKWIFALDRIEQLSEEDAPYLESDIDWDDHFYDVIGVTVNDEQEPGVIELLFTPEQGKYVETKPIHASQKGKYLETGEYRVRIKLIPNYELETKLMSFGEKVKVVSPPDLKSKLRDRLRGAAGQYE